MMQDLEEAMKTFIHLDAMRNAGIDEAFAEQFARNAMNFDKLPPGTQQRIAERKRWPGGSRA